MSPAASRLQLPPGEWSTLLDGLCARFPRVPRAVWCDRFARGRVQDAAGCALPADAPYRVGAEVRYYREVTHETPIAARERVLYADAHLVVMDKPHGLPVMPAGRHVEHTLLTRAVRAFGNADLVPLHRLDRETAGVVLLSASPRSRARYSALFRERRIEKVYEAIAPPLPQRVFPLAHCSHLAPGEPFFRMRECAGLPNARTEIDVIERGAKRGRYRLVPVTGRKHQLRVHMAALGAPIDNDEWYPQMTSAGEASVQGRFDGPDDSADVPDGVQRAAGDSDRSDLRDARAGSSTSAPLRLLACALRFVDPLSGDLREFTTTQALPPLDPA